MPVMTSGMLYIHTEFIVGSCLRDNGIAYHQFYFDWESIRIVKEDQITIGFHTCTDVDASIIQEIKMLLESQFKEMYSSIVNIVLTISVESEEEAVLCQM